MVSVPGSLAYGLTGHTRRGVQNLWRLTREEEQDDEKRREEVVSDSCWKVAGDYILESSFMLLLQGSKCLFWRKPNWVDVPLNLNIGLGKWETFEHYWVGYLPNEKAVPSFFLLTSRAASLSGRAQFNQSTAEKAQQCFGPNVVLFLGKSLVEGPIIPKTTWPNPELKPWATYLESTWMLSCLFATSSVYLATVIHHAPPWSES